MDYIVGCELGIACRNGFLDMVVKITTPVVATGVDVINTLQATCVDELLGLSVRNDCVLCLGTAD